MNILYLITDMGLGGAEVLLVNLANELRSHGHHIEICVLGSTNVHTSRLDPAISVHHVGMGKSMTGVLRALGQLRRLSKERKWDVLHAHMFHANLVGRLARGFFPKTRIVTTAHSNNEGGRGRMLAYRLTDFLSDVNTAVSKKALERYIEIGAFAASKSLCIYNFIDTSFYTKNTMVREAKRMAENLKDGDFAILTVGRLVPEKNQALLLRACARLVPEFPHLRVFLVGDGVLRGDLERLSHELGLTQHVQFCGAQRNVAEWCSFADLFVLTSEIEGFGLALAEAMACECPAISTDVGGCAEVVGNPRNLVAAGSEDQLAGKIKEFLAMSHEQRREVGQLSRARAVGNFDLEIIAGQWEEVYKKPLAALQ